MLGLKIIINIAIIIFLIKIIALILSNALYDIFNRKLSRSRLKSLDALNDINSKEKLIITICLDDKNIDRKSFFLKCRDALLMYKNLHIIFIDSENNRIRNKKRLDTNSKFDYDKYIDDINLKLNRKDGAILTYYSKKDNDKSAMIDQAMTEFFEKHKDFESDKSYIAIFDSSTQIDEYLVKNIEKYYSKNKYPKIIQLINMNTKNANELYGIKKWLCYIHNANKNCNEMIRNIFERCIRKILFIDKILPYELNFKGILIRLDIFLNGKMLDAKKELEKMSYDYYTKLVDVKTMYLKNNINIISNDINVNKDLEKFYTNLHSTRNYQRNTSYKKRKKNDKGFRNTLSKVICTLVMFYNFASAYIIFFAIVALFVAGKMNIPMFISFIMVMYFYDFLVIEYQKDYTKQYDKNENKFKKFMMRLTSFILYPLYLVYRFNGYYDYIRARGMVNTIILSDVKEIR